MYSLLLPSISNRKSSSEIKIIESNFFFANCLKIKSHSKKVCNSKGSFVSFPSKFKRSPDI